MERKIKLYSTGPAGGDCTGPYGVDLLCDLTVGEFIEEVLKDEREWGYIGIEKKRAIFGDPCCEYKRGELLYSLPEEYLSKKIVSARASGGWSRMDYYLTIQ